MKINSIDRILLLVTCLLAAYQVAVGIEGLGAFPILCYTSGFGVLLIAGLLIIILGFEVLDSPLVVILSTLIPLSLSLGLIWEFLPAWRIPYLVFTIGGFITIVITRLLKTGILATFGLASVHSVAGLVITLLPVGFSLSGEVKPGFILVGVGGALIGAGGLLLAFLKAGKPILPREKIFKLLPGLLLMATAAFVAGFALGLYERTFIG